MPGKVEKPDKAIVAARVEEILRIRIDGAQFHDVRAYAAEPERDWKLTDRELWAIIRKADDLLVARMEKKRSRAVALHVARREALYARAVNAGELSTALSVLKDMATIQGAYPDSKLAEALKIIKAQDERIRELEANEPRRLSLDLHSADWVGHFRRITGLADGVR